MASGDIAQGKPLEMCHLNKRGLKDVEHCGSGQSQYGGHRYAGKGKSGEDRRMDSFPKTDF